MCKIRRPSLNILQLVSFFQIFVATRVKNKDLEEK